MANTRVAAAARNLGPWLRATTFGCFLALAVATLLSVWQATTARDAVCRLAVTNLMDLDSAGAHLDADADDAWGFGPETGLLVVTHDATPVHSATCQFSLMSLALPRPILEAVAIDGRQISPIRLKLLGIALGVITDPVP